MKRHAVLLPVLVTFLVGAAPATAWTWPVDGPVLREFLLEGDPYAAGQHRGLDVAAAAGSVVRAPAGGTVTFAGTVPRGGRTVTISTPDGYAVTLLHLGSLGVARGASVDEGEAVGTVGRSGEAEHAEPYVHLGIRIAADANGYLDPRTLLPPREGAPAAAVEEPVAEAPGAQPPGVPSEPDAGAGTPPGVESGEPEETGAPAEQVETPAPSGSALAPVPPEPAWIGAPAPALEVEVPSPSVPPAPGQATTAAGPEATSALPAQEGQRPQAAGAGAAGVSHGGRQNRPVAGDGPVTGEPPRKETGRRGSETGNRPRRSANARPVAEGGVATPEAATGEGTPVGLPSNAGRIEVGQGGPPLGAAVALSAAILAAVAIGALLLRRGGPAAPPVGRSLPRAAGPSRPPAAARTTARLASVDDLARAA